MPKKRSVAQVGRSLCKNKYTVNWAITRVCNFKCEYCVAYRKRDKATMPSKDDLERAIRNISLIKKRRIDLSLTGGEPTLVKGLSGLVSSFFALAGSKAKKVTILSNMSRDHKYFDQFFRGIECPEKVKFIGSFHPTQIDLDRFIEHGIAVNSNGGVFSAWLLAVPGQVDFIRHAYDSMLTEGLDARVKIVRDGSKVDGRYAKEELDWVVHAIGEEEKNVDLLWSSGRWESYSQNDVLAKDFNHFRGMRCAGGMIRVAIEDDGSVYRAVCERGKVAPYGNIFSGEVDWSFMDNPMICGYNECRCGLAT